MHHSDVHPRLKVTDQFGTRTMERPKTSLLCTPAVKGGYTAAQRVGFRLEVDTPAGADPIPAVHFDRGTGLRMVRNVGKHKGDQLPAHALPAQIEPEAASFVGGAVEGSSSAWSAWYAEAQTVGAYCAEHTGDECDAAWLAAGVGRSATLSAVTESGEVLAVWHLADAWPAALALMDDAASGVDNGILQLTLSAQVTQFSFGPSAEGLCSSHGLSVEGAARRVWLGVNMSSTLPALGRDGGVGENAAAAAASL